MGDSTSWWNKTIYVEETMASTKAFKNIKRGQVLIFELFYGI